MSKFIFIAAGSSVVAYHLGMILLQAAFLGAIVFGVAMLIKTLAD